MDIIKSKTMTVTVMGATLPEAFASAIEWITESRPKAVVQCTAYPVDTYWAVQITYKG